MSLISQFYTRTKQDDARPVMTEDEIVIVIRRPNQRYGVYYIYILEKEEQPTFKFTKYFMLVKEKQCHACAALCACVLAS